MERIQRRLFARPKHGVSVSRSPFTILVNSRLKGYGTETHLGILDGQHLIHCLNSLRRYSHWDYYFRDDWAHKYQSPDPYYWPPLHMAHRSHCIGVLLQHLTCQPSLAIITSDWMETQRTPFPDFNVRRRCINHDAILDWQKNVMVPEELISGIERPKGAKVLNAPKELWELSDQR